MSEILPRYSQNAPRYTSYPTAPHFNASVSGPVYTGWLESLDDDQAVSIYIHVPFCRSMCWYCGCHTKIVRRYEPIAEYLSLLQAEIRRVGDILGRRHTVRHIHWGGGTPSILTPRDIALLADCLHAGFSIDPAAEFAVEIDPRESTRETCRAFAAAGVTRASLGVQDIDRDVQIAVNRMQPLETTARAVADLRGAGIASINADVMYGLPHQTVERVVATVDAVAGLDVQRMAVFGYAHVPWMKKHQRLIDETSLPDGVGRLAQSDAAAARLIEHGFTPIGLDHFVRPDDSLAEAQRAGRLHRNFQGYTADDCPALLGFGASAIGFLPQGYVQNAADIGEWGRAIASGGLAVSRGVAVSADDRVRRAVIERLMCDFRVNLAAVTRDYGAQIGMFDAELQKLAVFERDGLVDIAGGAVEMTDAARPYVRLVCAVFDQYLARGAAQHSRAV